MRNKAIFEQKPVSTDSLTIASRHMAEGIIASKQVGEAATQRGTSAREYTMIQWIPPSNDEVALNCDGAVQTRTGITKAACGGILRNSVGGTLLAFATGLGDCTVVEAELWGIFHGLTIVWGRGFRHIVVYSDSQVAVNLLVNGCHRTRPCAPLIDAIHRVHMGVGHVRWVHCLHEAKQVADLLAKHGLSMEQSLRVFYVIPSFVTNAIMADAACVSFPRGF